MSLRYPLGLLAFVAMRGLAHSRLTTALLVLAVAAGVGLQIPNTANLLGYSHAMLEEATTYGFGHVRVQDSREPIFDDADAIAHELLRVPHVRAAVPIVTLPAGAVARDQEIVCELHGIDPSSRTKPYRMAEGEDLGTKAPRGAEADDVLVGTGLATKLAVRVGDRLDVRVLLPAPRTEAGGGPTVVEYTLVVRGIVRGAFGAYGSLFMDRARLTTALARPHAASRVLVYADAGAGGAAGLSSTRRDAPAATDALARAVDARSRELGRNVKVVTWMSENPLADSALRANEVVGVVSHTMVILAVTIPIGALLYVTVERRRREIAVLASLGFARLEIFVAFLLQALAIGLTGAVLGCALGAGALAWFGAHPILDSVEFVVRPIASIA
jgi:ABC-type lipoprotein release transport system permease subunit